MAMTVDHLRIEHRVTVLAPFTDAAGTHVEAGRTAVLRRMSCDWVQERKVARATGHMKEFFEMGDEVFDKDTLPAATPVNQAVQPTEEDRVREQEEKLLAEIPHIGAAASIAHLYAERMREFRRAGQEDRAAAAFVLAVDWMGTYASWATSGGEGVALSYERDQFHAALTREFGYDPSSKKP